MIIDWHIETDIDSSFLSMMQICADLAEIKEGIQSHCAVSVKLCDDASIQEINREFRNTDRSTDVLSFPTVSYPVGQTAGTCEKLLRREYDDETEACFLGDIIISVPHALSQAEEYGHEPARELAYLLVHGLCHLMGYDHMEEGEQKRMRVKEEDILQAAGISREGSSDVSDDQLFIIARKAMEKSYSPYSHYPVGAALHATDGRIFQGCNIENASFGLTNCAERTALFKAVSEGARSFDTIAIASMDSAPWPCGACRQALNEFAPEIRVVVTWGKDKKEEAFLSELLPHGFGPKDLEKTKDEVNKDE